MTAFVGRALAGAAPVPQTHDAELSSQELVAALDQHIAEATDQDNSVAVLLLEMRAADRFAALVGDPPLQSFVDLGLRGIAASLRPVDRVIMLPQGKLCLVLPQLAHGHISTLAAHKVLRAIDSQIEAQVETYGCRQAVGIATFPEHATDAKSLLLCADAALGRASSSENRISVYRPDVDAKAFLSESFEQELRDALHDNTLEVYYQPQVHAVNGACASAEALLRWPGYAHGRIDPGRIVVGAESLGLVSHLTQWIVNTVLRHISELAEDGIRVGFSINLSPQNVVDIEFADVVEQALATWGVAAEQVTFEITEGSMIEDVNASLSLVKRLKTIGARVAVDDFGTGYSSLAYLKRFPLDELKIDKVFVQNVLESKADRQIVRSVIDLAHNFELIAVAEGVEDQATAEALRDMGCDLIQGYVFGKPVPIDQFKSFAARSQGVRA